LDLLRTRFAAQGNEKVYSSLLYSIQHILKDEGIRGFYRGASTGVMQIFPYMGLFFASYETSRTWLNVGRGWDEAIAGTVAGTLSKFVVFPFDLVRKRLQVQGPTRTLYAIHDVPLYKGTIASARIILHREGVRGLYKGCFVSLVKAAPTSAVTMWTFSESLRFLEWLREK